MELTYTVRGADTREYGPASLEQITAWIREGRLPPQSAVRRSDMDYWAPAASFTELKPTLDTLVEPPPATAAAASSPPATAASGRVKSNASWFYWVAALSLVNTISAFTGSSWRFILGLGITQVFDGVGAGLGSAGKAVVLGLDLLAAGVCVLLGVFAGKGHQWAFVVGMVLFTLDGLISLLVQDWFGVAFHAFLLYVMFSGFRAARE